MFSIEIGSERMVELIQASPSANLLLPLTTALEQELGREPRVAREVAEVAEDIRTRSGEAEGNAERWRRVTRTKEVYL